MFFFSILHDHKLEYILTKTVNTEESHFHLFYKSAEFRAFNSEKNRRAIFSERRNGRKKKWEERKILLLVMQEHPRCIPIDRAVENRHGNRRRRGSARTIEEVVTNKVAGERIRLAESKNDGPPLAAAVVHEAHQWPRCFRLNMQAWPPALPFS